MSAWTSSNGSFARSAKGTVTGGWYKVRLAPGTADPVRLTPLPIAPQPAGPSPLFPAFNTALSASGQELAVAEYTAWTGMAVKVFSVATGRLLHDWTRLADTLRELNVGGPATGDLLTDSNVVWVAPIVKYPADLVQSPAEVLSECTMSPGSSLLVSANGKTFSCTAQAPSDGFTQSFRTYPITLDTTAAEKGRNDYQVTHAEAKGLDTPMVLWASPTGDTIIAAWNTYAKGTLTDSINGLHIGAISHGKFTPLRFPKGSTLFGNPSMIAF